MSAFCICGNELLPYPLQCASCEHDLCGSCSIFGDISMCIPCRDKATKNTCDHCTIKYDYLERKICKDCAGLYCSDECSAEHFCLPMKCKLDDCYQCHSTLVCEKCKCQYCRPHFNQHTKDCGYYYCGWCNSYKRLCAHSETCQSMVCLCVVPRYGNHSMCKTHKKDFEIYSCYACHFRYRSEETKQIIISRFTVKEYRELTIKVLNVCLECYQKVQSFSDCLILKGLPPDIIEMFILHYVVNQTHCILPFGNRQ